MLCSEKLYFSSSILLTNCQFSFQKNEAGNENIERIKEKPTKFFICYVATDVCHKKLIAGSFFSSTVESFAIHKMMVINKQLIDNWHYS